MSLPVALGRLQHCGCAPTPDESASPAHPPSSSAPSPSASAPGKVPGAPHRHRLPVPSPNSHSAFDSTQVGRLRRGMPVIRGRPAHRLEELRAASPALANSPRHEAVSSFVSSARAQQHSRKTLETPDPPPESGRNVGTILPSSPIRESPCDRPTNPVANPWLPAPRSGSAQTARAAKNSFFTQLRLESCRSNDPPSSPDNRSFNPNSFSNT